MAAAIVLVHGQYHGAWCWRDVVDGLARRGIRAIAVDLPGRGGNAGVPISLAASVAIVEEAIRAAGGPVVVCGHSAGGTPISYVAGCDGVRALVYLAAVVPTPDGLMQSFIGAVMEKVGSRLQVDGDMVSLASLQDATEMLYHDCRPEDAQWAFERLVPEPVAGDPAVPEPQFPEEAWQAVNKTYVVCADDRGMPPEFQRRLADRLDASVEWPVGHSPFLSRPALVVDLLEKMAREAG